MKQAFFTFNRGRVSPLSLGRVEQQRVAVSAETMTNWIPRLMGPMSLRPGTQYINSTNGNNAARFLKFIFSITDTAKIELTANTMRVFVDDAVVTRPSVSSAVANSAFTTDLASWTDNDEAGGSSVWVAGGYMGLTGNGTAAAIRDQTVTVAAADLGVKHALDIVVERGPVVCSVGSTTGDDDYITETTLDTGYHSLSFTPTGNFSIRFLSRLKRQVLVDSCAVASSGAMSLTTPWAAADLGLVRYEQSGDVIFVACDGYLQHKIERRGTESWSIVEYMPNDGPFNIQNTTATTITPSAISGNITLTASTGIFRSTNVGSLYEITSLGQTVSSSITSDNTFSNTISITGSGNDRIMTITVDDQAGYKTITNAADNGGGLIRITCVGHGGTTGEEWLIDDVLGTTEANGLWTITKIDNDTFDLQGSAFVNPYTSGGTAIVRTGQLYPATISNALAGTGGKVRIVTSSDHGYTTGKEIGIWGVTGTTEANGIWTITVLSSIAFELEGSTFVNPYVAGGTSVRLSAATATLQRSLTSASGPWSDVSGKSWIYDTTETYDDGLDNQIAWYRIGVKTSEFRSGQTDVGLSIATGSITGYARVTGYTSDTVVDAEVITDLGGTTATEYWSEGIWSPRRGYPSAVSLHDGRLWWSGKDKIWGSISDSFSSFDPNYEGDAGPISRSIGQGPVDTVNWLLSMQRLILGGQGAEHSARSSSLDEPMTPTNFGMRIASTLGSAPIDPIKIDQTGVYVQRGGTRLYELSFNGDSYDYASKDMTILVPEIGEPNIVRLDVQRQPDTRIHAVRSDGTVAMGVFDRAENVLAWFDIETDGLVEDVIVMPSVTGTIEDTVYYVVNRTINGSTVRYLEKWAFEADCRGGTLNKQADAFITYTGAATTTITGLSHLEGESVVVWADGADVGTKSDYTQTYTVSGGQITLATAASNVVVGLPYTAQWKSTKLLAMDKVIVEALTAEKNLDHLGLVLAWVHPKGLRFGPDFTNLDDMPEIEAGTAIDQDTIRTAYDEEMIEFPGTWDVNARICLQAQAPRPCTVKALVPNVRIGQ